MTMTCFHCKKMLDLGDSSASARVGFRDSCPHCHSDLHVCLNCRFFDEGSHHECRESSAEWVKKKDTANVCEYFRATTGTEPATGKTTDKVAALEELFKK